jgi:hypothetical protein
LVDEGRRAKDDGRRTTDDRRGELALEQPG